MIVLLIIGIIFISSFFYYAIGLLFYNFLVDFISKKLGVGEWAWDAYHDCPVIATILWPIIFIIWVGEMFFVLPFVATYKLLEKIFHI
jgi:hypothetical protein